MYVLEVFLCNEYTMKIGQEFLDIVYNHLHLLHMILKYSGYITREVLKFYDRKQRTFHLTNVT